MEKNTDEGWNPYRLVILVQITLFYKHKTTGDVWDPWRFVIRVQKSLFCIQNHTWGLRPVETSDSDANHAVLHAKTTEEGWDP